MFIVKQYEKENVKINKLLCLLRRISGYFTWHMNNELTKQLGKAEMSVTVVPYRFYFEFTSLQRS